MRKKIRKRIVFMKTHLLHRHQFRQLLAPKILTSLPHLLPTFFRFQSHSEPDSPISIWRLVSQHNLSSNIFPSLLVMCLQFLNLKYFYTFIPSSCNPTSDLNSLPTQYSSQLFEKLLEYSYSRW
jgi:hypothetical protein